MTNLFRDKIAPLIFATSLVIIPYSCKKISPDIPTKIETKIPETTKVLEETQEIISFENNEIIFEEGKIPEYIEEGNVLVSGITEEMPNGVLKEVVSISEETSTIITKESTLENAIENCDISFSNNVPAEGAIFSTMLNGVKPSGEGINFNLDFDDTLFYDFDGNLSTTNDQVRATGSLDFNLDFNTKLKILDFEVKELDFEATLNDNVNLDVKCGLDLLDFNENVKIGDYKFTPFVAAVIPSIPPLPIIIVPSIEVYANLSGNISSEIELNVMQSAAVMAGLNYKDKTWQPRSDFTNSFDFSQPIINLESFLKTSLNTRLNLLFYGISGPYVEAGCYSRIEVKPTQNPYLSLYGGLEAKIGVSAKIIGNTVLDYGETIINFEKKLLELESLNSTIQKIAYTSNADGDDETFFMNTDGTNPSQVTFNSVRNAFTRYDSVNDQLIDTTIFDINNYDVAIRDRATGALINRFTTNPSYQGNAATSKNGKFKAWRSDIDGTMKVYVQDSEKTFNPIPLTDNLTFANFPAWGEDGKELFIDGFETGDSTSNIYKITFNTPYNFDNFQILKIPQDDSKDNIHVSIHPDGDLLTYESSKNIVEYDEISGLTRFITNDSNLDSHPAYDHSGDNILFSRGNFGDRGIRRIGRDLSGLTTIIDTVADEYGPIPIEYDE